MIADKDDFLRLFLNIISDKQGKMQREINTGNAKKTTGDIYISMRIIGGSEIE